MQLSTPVPHIVQWIAWEVRVHTGLARLSFCQAQEAGCRALQSPGDFPGERRKSVTSGDQR